MEQARQSAIASVMSQHAANGTTGSSAEAQDIQNINLQVASQGANIATNLLNQGISESEFASGIYENLMQTSIAQDTALSNSISNFSGALASAGIRSFLSRHPLRDDPCQAPPPHSIFPPRPRGSRRRLAPMRRWEEQQTRRRLTRQRRPKDDDKSAKPDTSPQVKVDFAQPGSGMSSRGSAGGDRPAGAREVEHPAASPSPKPQRQDLSSQIQDAQTWGAIAIAFGALASLRTRQPLTTALNSAAAALTASQQRQQDVYDRATQQWQQDTKFAMENFNYEQRAYEDLMDNIKNREGLALNTWGKLDARERNQIPDDDGHAQRPSDVADI